MAAGRAMSRSTRGEASAIHPRQPSEADDRRSKPPQSRDAFKGFPCEPPSIVSEFFFPTNGMTTGHRGRQNDRGLRDCQWVQSHRPYRTQVWR